VRRPLQTIGYLPGSVAAKHGSARRVGELVDQTAAAEHRPVVLPRSEGRALVEFDLGGQRIAIGRGAIVGIRANDAGAADLADLLGARRAACAGELVVDGADAAALTADTLRAIVFAPPHDAALFSGSIVDNLGGAPDGPPSAIAASGLDEVVERAAAGLDEPVGENGARLSGGQRQRVLLARALLTTQPVLVLHEPMTAVDPVTEARIATSAARHLRAGGRTAVLITGSPALLAECDAVYSASEVRR
jgi:ABC-type bacteriocin/lantibiotic exporter with double-glycine peptidase domain